MSKLWEPNANFDTSRPQSFGNMPYKRLYENLTSKELTELLRDAKRLHWEVLDFGECGLSILPDILGELENLRVLELGNSLTRPLNFSGKMNKFTFLPNTIGKLANLQWLDLSDSKIRELPASIERLTNLQSLNLSYCHLKSIPYSVVALELPFIIVYS